MSTSVSSMSLALIFDKLNIDTGDVLAAAGTKWNFLPFKPGLVGGHCISVDPYYLAHKAQEVGHDPQVILSGRRINDSMGLHVASSVVKLLHQKDLPVKGGRALILGLAFKENTGDVRNSKVVDVYQELKSFGMEVDVYRSLSKSGTSLERIRYRISPGDRFIRVPSDTSCRTAPNFYYAGYPNFTAMRSL